MSYLSESVGDVGTSDRDRLSQALAVLKSCYRAKCIYVSCAYIPVPAVLQGASVHFNEVCLMQSSFLLHTNFLLV